MANRDLHSPLLGENGTRNSRPNKRSCCNDILFAVLFLIMFAGMIVISSVAFTKGDPKLLLSTNSPEYIKQYGTQYAAGWIQNGVAELKAEWQFLLIGAGIAIACGIGWILLLQHFTKFFIYLTLILGVLVVLGLGGYLVDLGVRQAHSDYKTVGYCLFGVAFLLVLLIVFLKKKIALTAAMFSETCKGVQHNPALFLTALLTIALFVGFSAFWTSSFVYLYSVPGNSVNITTPATPLAADRLSAESLPQLSIPPQFNESIRGLMFYMIFGFLWTAAFLSAVFQHSVAGAVSGWYFSRSGAGMGQQIGSPAVVSFLRGFTTSFGSLAFGSLVIAIVEFMALMLRLTKRANYQNKFIVYLIRCLQCLLACVESLVKFINKFAYIYVAMHGYSFCKAARECFDLLSRNMFDAVIMDVIGSFVLFVGKILFTAATVFIVLLANPSLGAITVCLVGVIAFVILHIIQHIVGAGVDTVFICYLEDLEMNPDGNLFMSPEVHAMLQDRVKAHRAEKV